MKVSNLVGNNGRKVMNEKNEWFWIYDGKNEGKVLFNEIYIIFNPIEENLKILSRFLDK